VEWDERLVEAFQQEVRHNLVVHLPLGLPPGSEERPRRAVICSEWLTSTGIDVEFSVAELGNLFQLITLHSQHAGMYVDIAPTGKRFSIAGLAAFKIGWWKIAEHLGLYDMQSDPAQGSTCRRSPRPTQAGREVPARVQPLEAAHG